MLLPPLMYDLFIFSLSLHTHSPTIEMYQQVILVLSLIVYIILLHSWNEFLLRQLCTRTRSCALMLKKSYCSESYDTPMHSLSDIASQVALERLRVLGDVMECAAFVDIAGQVVCSEEEVKKVLQEMTAGYDITSP